MASSIGEADYRFGMARKDSNNSHSCEEQGEKQAWARLKAELLAKYFLPSARRNLPDDFMLDKYLP